MTEKQSLTETELRTALLTAVRQHPDCTGVMGVVIVPEIRHAASSWKFHWVRSGDRAAPPAADQIAYGLQGQYLVRPDEA
jgi:hypothetical protein